MTWMEAILTAARAVGFAVFLCGVVGGWVWLCFKAVSDPDKALAAAVLPLVIALFCLLVVAVKFGGGA